MSLQDRHDRRYGSVSMVALPGGGCECAIGATPRSVAPSLGGRMRELNGRETAAFRVSSRPFGDAVAARIREKLHADRVRTPEGHGSGA